jgi:hypothetical protein
MLDANATFELVSSSFQLVSAWQASELSVDLPENYNQGVSNEPIPHHHS